MLQVQVYTWPFPGMQPGYLFLWNGLNQALEELALNNSELAKILQMRFLDNSTAETVANKLNLSPSTFYERQKVAINEITAILGKMDLQTRQERYDTLERKLVRQQIGTPIGIDELVESLRAQLSQSDKGWIISIEGIGGIGKTTVAGQLVRELILHDVSWENVAWVTARQTDFPRNNESDSGTATQPVLTMDALLEQLYTQLIIETPLPGLLSSEQIESLSSEQILAALESYLCQHKCLIVIDNLETLADVEALLPVLRRLIKPSKFILTSRESFYSENDIYHKPLTELNEHDALQLVRAEAQSSNLMEVVSTTDAQLHSIYETVGGNPLALRLIVGQLHIFDLTQVLDDLKEARGQNAESLYTFIFRWAWDHLDEPARCLLIAMLLTSDYGDTLDELATICADDLASGTVQTGIKQLVMLNLVESRGGLFERRFTIHNLTRSFLHRQVKIWQGA